MKKQTPGTVLNALLKKHGLNYSSLAKAIGLSGAMVRLIALDQNPVSAAVAFRLAAFFKMRPEYWLDLQSAHDIAVTAKDKKLAKALKGITTVDKAKKETVKRGRKPKAKKAAKKSGTAKGAKKTAGKRGRPAKKTGARKVKSVRAAKKPAGKRGRPAAKKTRGRPVSKAKAKAKPKTAKAKAVKVRKAPAESRPVAPAPVPASQPAGTVNEPNI
jgi:addiction module HigA family antidote